MALSLTAHAQPVYVAPARPVQPVVVAAPAPMVAAGGYATMAPPRVRAERRPPPSRPGQVWIAGSWGWSGGQYAWTPGRWEDPPRARARWVAPRWQRRGRQWEMTPGRWQ